MQKFQHHDFPTPRSRLYGSRSQSAADACRPRVEVGGIPTTENPTLAYVLDRGGHSTSELSRRWFSRGTTARVTSLGPYFGTKAILSGSSRITTPIQPAPVSQRLAGARPAQRSGVPQDRRAEAQRNPSPLFRSLGSTVLDLAVVAVAALARKSDDHSAGDGQALAPQRLVWAVEISVRWSLARRTSQGFSRSPPTDQSNGSGELPLGCTANPRRTAHAWVQGFPSDRIPLLGDRAPKSRAIVADVYSQSGARLQIPGRT